MFRNTKGEGEVSQAGEPSADASAKGQQLTSSSDSMDLGKMRAELVEKSFETPPTAEDRRELIQ